MAVLKKRRRSSTSEKVRNVMLVIVAVATVFIFYNLDIMKKGESVFSRSAKNKLYFRGDLKLKAYTTKEYDKILAFVKKYDKLIESATIETTVDNSYGKVSKTSQILFEVHFELSDGATISTPTRRTTRGNLVSAILTKMRKDMKAYRGLMEKGTKVKSLVNTM